MPDRYAAAVRARRAELRARHAELTGGHRVELRSALALSRVTATAEITTALAALAADAAAHLERADRAARRGFPARLDRAVGDTAVRLHTRWAGALRPNLVRIAASRSLPAPQLPTPRPAGSFGSPRPVATGRLHTVLVGAAHGAALGRLLLLPLALLPVWGLPVLGGRPLAPLAAGAGVAAVALAARARWVAVERARLRRHTDEALAAARVGLEVDLGRRLLELEAVTTGAWDAAARRRRADIERELALLAATPPGQLPPPPPPAPPLPDPSRPEAADA